MMADKYWLMSSDPSNGKCSPYPWHHSSHGGTCKASGHRLDRTVASSGLDMNRANIDKTVQVAGSSNDMQPYPTENLEESGEHLLSNPVLNHHWSCSHWSIFRHPSHRAIQGPLRVLAWRIRYSKDAPRSYEHFSQLWWSHSQWGHGSIPKDYNRIIWYYMALNIAPCLEYFMNGTSTAAMVNWERVPNGFTRMTFHDSN